MMVHRILLVMLLVTSMSTFANLGDSVKPRSLLGIDQTPNFLPVEEAFKLEVEQQGDSKVRFYWRIADNYYLYKEKFQANLILEEKLYPLKIQFPKAISRTDEYFGEVEVYYSSADLLLDFKEIESLVKKPLDRAIVQVIYQGCADAGLCYTPQQTWFDISFSDKSIAKIEPKNLRFEQKKPEKSDRATSFNSGYASSLFLMLLFAFTGGIILNLMPCIFPILSLKIISFSDANRNIRIDAWSYAAGVITSFVIVASVLITLQSAGRAIGWGFQLQSPVFVTALVYLFFILGLALSGAIQLGAGLMGIGDSLASKSGTSGSFFTGVLAVVVASPCSAPFMGTALGFAATQPATTAVMIFVSLGVGMASPLVLLAHVESIRKRLPQPGRWMETLKQMLAFPLYASSIWLLWVAGSILGVNTMGVIIGGGLCISFGFWIASTSGWRKMLGLAFVVLGIFCGMMAAQNANYADSTDSSVKKGTEVWSQERLAKLISEGKPVFVDVTAKWCITCIANESAVLFTDKMSKEFRKRDITYLVADWTEYEPEIAKYVESHGRAGIPLYVFYPSRNNSSDIEKPIILPQILTHSIVLQALNSDK